MGKSCGTLHWSREGSRTKRHEAIRSTTCILGLLRGTQSSDQQSHLRDLLQLQWSNPNLHVLGDSGDISALQLTKGMKWLSGS
jgi:hypothetical protein